MVLRAQQLQTELDSYLFTPFKDRKFEEEAERLNHFAIIESEGFLERLLGRTKPANKAGNNLIEKPQPPAKKSTK